ncbi:hypothetical protein [Hymenobacter sp. GOD-10R]|uniref:hypothetical protein n=1 Tax=Hymenobacter sp. GOD-10R TaxID=3093922 RepID=UPI002D78B322|nr:hypothetical protein [Hymenobacter sp. GOD-10R]WRQ26703.1 hypothetical protein SD425_16645 [Hymenobacter sp. GOD-10R]
MTIKITPDPMGFCATAYDNNGNYLGSAACRSKKDAEHQARQMGQQALAQLGQLAQTALTRHF